MIRSTRTSNPSTHTRPAGRGFSPTVALLFAALLAGPVAADDVGELVLFQSRTPARAAEVNQNFEDIKQAVNSKTTVGFDFASSDSSASVSNVSSTPTVALSVTLTAPGPGYIEVDFSSYVSIGHAQNSSSYVVCVLETDTASPDANTGRLAGSRRLVHVPTVSATGDYYPHLDTHGVLAVDAAGSFTLHAVCDRSASTTSGTLAYRTLTATYHSDRF